MNTNNFNAETFENPIASVKQMTDEVEIALNKCLNITAQLSSVISSDQNLSSIWDSFHKSLETIITKYNEKTSALIKGVQEYGQVTAMNDMQLHRIIYYINARLEGLMQSINSL